MLLTSCVREGSLSISGGPLLKSAICRLAHTHNKSVLFSCLASVFDGRLSPDPAGPHDNATQCFRSISRDGSLEGSISQNHQHQQLAAASDHSMSRQHTGSSLVAVAQMTATGDQVANFEVCKQLANEAAGKGCSMLFLPECCSFIGLNQQEVWSYMLALNP